MTATKIKEVAGKLFAFKGYEATSLADIAREVGIKKPSIYAHFPSKADLYFEIFEELIEEYEEAFQSISKSITKFDIPERLYKFLELSVIYVMDNIHKDMFYTRIVMFPPHELSARVYERIKKTRQKILCYVEESFRKGMDEGLIRNGNIDDMVTAYNYMIKGFTLDIMFMGEGDYLSRCSSIWDIFWSGIKKE